MLVKLRQKTTMTTMELLFQFRLYELFACALIFLSFLLCMCGGEWALRIISSISRRFRCDNYWSSFIGTLVWSIHKSGGDAWCILGSHCESAERMGRSIPAPYKHKRNWLANPFSANVHATTCTVQSNSGKYKMEEKSIKTALMDVNLIQKPIIQKWTFRFSYLWIELLCYAVSLLCASWCSCIEGFVPTVAPEWIWVMLAMLFSFFLSFKKLHTK